MPAIKIAYVIPTLDQSGAEKQLTLLATALPKERFEILVVALTRGGYYERILREHGIHVEILHKRTAWDPFALVRLTRLLSSWRPQVVQTWLFAANCYGRVAAGWANVPVIIGSERCVDRWKRPYQFAIDRYLSRRCPAIIANTRAVARFYEQVGIDAVKLRIIPNAVEPPAAADPGTRARVLEPLGLRPDAPTIGFIGRLWPQKRLQDLIWAVDVLRISGWEAQLLIAGDGPRRAALERLTRSLDLTSAVRFLGHRTDIGQLLAAVDILALPSQYEGMPNVVLEAMAAGRPVVASRFAGIEELIEDGQTGKLFTPRQPIELAKVLSQLLGDEPLRQRLATAAQERVVRDFSVAQLVSHHVELYEQLLGTSNR